MALPSGLAIRSGRFLLSSVGFWRGLLWDMWNRLLVRFSKEIPHAARKVASVPSSQAIIYR